MSRARLASSSTADDVALAAHQRRQVGRLRPRRGAQVEHPLARLRVHRVRDHHRRARLRHQRPARKQLRAVQVVRMVEHERLGEVRVTRRVDAGARELRQHLVDARAQRVDARGALGGLVVGAHQCAGRVGPELLPPHLGDPVGVGVQQRGRGRRRVAEARERRLALARRAAEHGVHEPVAAASRGLGEIHRLGDGRVICHAVHVEELVRTEPQRCDHLGVEVAHGAVRQPLEHVVQRAAALHDSVRQPHRERAVAAVELVPLGLGAKGVVGVRAAARTRGGSPCTRSGGPASPSGG